LGYIDPIFKKKKGQTQWLKPVMLATQEDVVSHMGRKFKRLHLTGWVKQCAPVVPS
jgi:hypothetical protein